MHIVGHKAGGGSFKSTPDNLRSNDSLEALLGVCAGPVVGPTRGLKSITIDGTPIEDESGTMNFQDFTVFVADGDPAKHPQRPQMQLGGGTAPTSVGLDLSNTNPAGTPGPWVTKTVTNTNADALDLRFIVSQLYKQNKSGIYGVGASIEIQMKPTGTTNWINPTQGNPTTTYNETGVPVSVNGTDLTAYIARGYFDLAGNWLPAASSYFKINGKTTSPYIWELRVAVPNDGAYAGKGWDVRARLIEQESVDADPNFEKRIISWESVSAVYTDPLGGTEAWRGLAWVYIFGKATDQLTGVPDIAGPWDTKIVSVPPSTVYDPEARTYTGTLWDGSYAKSFTMDPAWIINDAISDPLWGVSSLAVGSYLNKWDALEASKWFCELVPDGNGGFEPRNSMSLVVDQPQKADELIQYMAGAVGAIAWDSGNGEWRLKVDKPETPADIFTLENIEGDFNYAHSDIDSRYNDITMSYLNAEFDYREDRVRVWDQAHIDQYGRKPTTLVAVGCTGRQEAYRRAMLRLRTSINEWRTVSFTTTRRGRLIRPLDTILIADSGLGYTLPTGTTVSNPADSDPADNRTTGRVVAYDSGLKKLTLRDTVRLEIGASYTLAFSSPNPNYNPDSEDEDRTKPTIVTTANVVNTSGQRGDVRDIYINVALPSDVAPQLTVALSADGLPSMPRAFRVLTVKPEDDGERITITAMELDSGKWDAADNVDPQAIEMQTPSAITPMPLEPIEGSLLTPTLIPTDSIVDKRLLAINWLRPTSLFVSGFRVGYKLNDGPLVILADNFQDTTFEMQDPVDGSYEFFIWTIDRRGQLSRPLTAQIDLDEMDFRAGSGVGPGSNRVYFSQFEAGPHGWDIVANPSGLTANLVNSTVSGYPALTLNVVSTAAGQTVSLGSDLGYMFPVTGGERLSAQALAAWGGPVGATLEVAWYNDAGVFISKSTVSSSFSAGPPIYKTNGFVTVPATALLGQLRFTGVSSGAGAWAITLMRPMVAEAGPSQTTFPSFTPGPNADNGATRNVWRGEWASGVEYSEGDVVSFGGSSFGAIVSHTAGGGNAPPNSSFWTTFASATYNAILTNESHTVAADASGAVSDFSTAGGSFFLYYGDAQLTSGVTYSVASSTGVAVSINSLGVYTVTSMSADQGTAVLRATHGSITIDKVYSISKSRAGAAGVTVFLTNEAHVVPTDSNGANGDFSTASGQIVVMFGDVNVTSSATIGVPITVGCTAQVNNAANSPVSGQPKGFYRVTAMSSDTATLTIPVTYGSTSVSPVFSLSKSKAGPNGAAAKTITLISDKQLITFDENGTASPSVQTVALTINRQNSTAPVTWTVYSAAGDLRGSSSTYITVAGDTLSATVSLGQFNTGRGSTEGIIVKATITDGVTITDQLSIVKVQKGATGANAKTIQIIADRYGITYDANGNLSPVTQTNIFSIAKQNTSATVSWLVYDMNGNLRSPTNAYLSTDTGDTVTMTAGQFDSARNGTSGVVIQASAIDGTTLIDKTHVLRVVQGAAAVGFVQDSPVPSATFVNQMWYKPTAKELYRATMSGSGGWVRILGDLSVLNSIGTNNIDANAISQTISQTTALNFTWGGSGLAYPRLMPVIKLNISSTGGAIRIGTEFYNSVYHTAPSTVADFCSRVALTRGPSSTPITMTGGGAPTYYDDYLLTSGAVALTAILEESLTQTGGQTSYAVAWGIARTILVNAQDAPPAGTYTYTLWLGASDAAARTFSRIRQFMALTELKR